MSCTIFVQPTDDVVAVLPQPRQLRRAARRHVQDVPHVLIRALETAEPDNSRVMLLQLGLFISAANQLIGEVVQSLLRPSPG